MSLDSSQQLYESPDIVHYYARRQGLLFGEEALLTAAAHKIKDGRVLDVGVGAGRTTPILKNFHPLLYIGVDYSAGMVEHCRERFPDSEFHVADARSMPDFPDSSFDFVLFSWNGIDSVDFEGRIAVVREVFRLLAPGGLFAFSSANGRNLPPRPWTAAALGAMDINWRKPKQFLYGTAQWLLGFIHFLRLRSLEVSRDDHSIRVDQAHNFKLVRCLVSPSQQALQLSRAGFIETRIFDRDGSEFLLSNASFDSCPVCYLAKKPE